MTVSTVVALLIAVLPVFGWSSATVGTVSAALVVLGGAVSAALVSVDRMLPLLVGVAKAVLAVVAAFGLHVPDNWVAALMAVLTVVGGFATRAQVGAVQPPVDRQGRNIRATPQGLINLGGAPPVEDPIIRRGEFVTEQLPAVVADAEDHRGHQQSYRQPRHAMRDGLGRLAGDLGPA
jgi:hypothetical protein